MIISMRGLGRLEQDNSHSGLEKTFQIRHININNISNPYGNYCFVRNIFLETIVFLTGLIYIKKSKPHGSHEQ